MRKSTCCTRRAERRYFAISIFATCWTTDTIVIFHPIMLLQPTSSLSTSETSLSQTIHNAVPQPPNKSPHLLPPLSNPVHNPQRQQHIHKHARPSPPPKSRPRPLRETPTLLHRCLQYSQNHRRGQPNPNLGLTQTPPNQPIPTLPARTGSRRRRTQRKSRSHRFRRRAPPRCPQGREARIRR